MAAQPGAVPRPQAPQAGIAKHPATYIHNATCFSSWFKQFRNYCDLLQIPNNTKYQTMLCFMDQDSFDAVESLGLTPDQRNNIEDNATYILIRDALKNQDEIIPPDLILKHRKQKDGESVTSYSKILTKLALDAYPNDQNILENHNLIQAFVTGVKNDELGIELLRIGNLPTLTAAVNAANDWLGALKTRRFIKTETTFGPELSEKVYNVISNVKDDHQTSPSCSPCKQTCKLFK